MSEIGQLKISVIRHTIKNTHCSGFVVYLRTSLTWPRDKLLFRFKRVHSGAGRWNLSWEMGELEFCAHNSVAQGWTIIPFNITIPGNYCKLSRYIGIELLLLLPKKITIIVINLVFWKPIWNYRNQNGYCVIFVEMLNSFSIL